MNCFQNFISVFWSTHGGKLLVIKHLSLCLTSVNAFDIADESVTEGVGTSCPCLAVVQMLTWQRTAKLGKPEGAPPLFSSLAIRYLKCCKTVWVWVCEMKTVELLSAGKKMNYQSSERQSSSGFRSFSSCHIMVKGRDRGSLFAEDLRLLS